MRITLAFGLSMACLLGCSGPAPDAVAGPAPAAALETPAPAAAAVAPAEAPIEAPAEAPAGTPASAEPGEPALARLSGRVSYPSEYLPPMRVCALASDDPGTAHCEVTAENQAHYALSVPAGEWLLLAWPQDAGTAGDPGLLSRASECLGTGGMDCSDHALQPVRVGAGEQREGLDINDWYYDPGEFPPPMPPQDAAP